MALRNTGIVAVSARRYHAGMSCDALHDSVGSGDVDGSSGVAGPVVFSVVGVRCAVPADGGARMIFDGLSFRICAGEIVDLTGPSGCGKSTLLTAFARLNPHADGRFALRGRDADSFSPRQWRRHVAYLPQKPVLPGASVADAIRLPFTFDARRGGDVASDVADTAARPAPLPRPSVTARLRAAVTGSGGGDDSSLLLPDERIRIMLDRMGCADVDLTRVPHDLSGGQAARVALARTLLTDPDVLLADEVDAGLDDANAELVASIMADAAARGMAIVRIRHRPPDGRATRTVVLDGGVLRDATPHGDGNHRDSGTPGYPDNHGGEALA